MSQVGRYPDFEAVRQLPASTLRTLLHSGDAAERAWAGWALALALGQEASPELAAEAQGSPTPGVRSLLLVILAGHGELDLVRRFGDDDPDDDVRASACRYLATSYPAREPSVEACLSDRLRSDPSARVRLQILKLHAEHRIELAPSLLETATADADLDVRGLAADCLISQAPTAFPAALQSRVLIESNPELRDRLARTWIADDGGRHLFARLLQKPDLRVEATHSLLSQLHAAGRRFRWSDLQSVARREEDLLNLHVVRLLDGRDAAVAAPWLLRVWERPLDFPPPKDHDSWRAHRQADEVGLAARQPLRRAVRRLDSSALSPEDVRRLTRLAAELRRSLEDARYWSIEDDGVDLEALPDTQKPRWYTLDIEFIAGVERLIGKR
jgi:hypothetical protein